MRRAFPILLVALGVVFVGAGGYTVYRGFDARDQVRSELAAQRITTPDDATIPGATVDDAATAQSMADVIGVHTAESTGGRTYAEIGRFLADGGGDTNEEAEAARGPDGQPVRNPLRQMAFEASALRTSLYTSVMAFNVADLVLGLGLMIAVVGFVFTGLGMVFTGAGRRHDPPEPLLARPAMEPVRA